MASHWKSTPTYWCKFCSTYVKETPLERKNHESSIKHQNNIQRSLRELHKTKERDEREKQRAKDEVARLNGLVGGKKGGQSSGIIGAKVVGGSSAGGAVYDAAQRKAHAEQLAAMGVQIPEELKKEITGMGEWQTISTRVVEDSESAGGSSLADILKQENVKKEREDSKDGLVKGVRKRPADEEEEEEEGRRKRGAWGSKFKVYPGDDAEKDAGVDLDALLSGVAAKKKEQLPHAATGDATSDVKIEPGPDDSAADVKPDVKPENADENDASITAPAIPVFKKRKSKK